MKNRLQPWRGDMYYSEKYTGPGCQAISKESGRLCNNGAIVENKAGLKLCAVHEGMLRAGWSFFPDPQEVGDSRW